jgi:inhibitor of KinA
MQITPLGDSALIVRVSEDFSAPEGTLNAVLAAQHILQAAQLPGVIEFAPAYTTVAMFYDPIGAVDGGAPIDNLFDWFEQRIRAVLSSAATDADRTADEDNVVHAHDLPVCYDPEFGFDLEHVAKHTGASVEQVVSMHGDAEYRVSCLGFTPGFPFLSGLPAQLATPRRSTPRKEIPAGSVAIGGAQTGIYPLKSPGGWNVIGRTSVRLFDPQKDPPALLRPGDRVRFRAISRSEFERSTL